MGANVRGELVDLPVMVAKSGDEECELSRRNLTGDAVSITARLGLDYSSNCLKIRHVDVCIVRKVKGR